MATIYSEQSAATVLAALDAGRITALPPAGSLPASTVRRCTHIVGLMGHEPIAAAPRCRCRRRPGWPGHRHGISGGTRAPAGPARRACLACREDSRMRRPVPPQTLAAAASTSKSTRTGFTVETARPARVLHACHGRRPHALRERGPLPDARTVRHARHFPGHLHRIRRPVRARRRISIRESQPGHHQARRQRGRRLRNGEHRRDPRSRTYSPISAPGSTSSTARSTTTCKRCSASMCGSRIPTMLTVSLACDPRCLRA